MVSDKVMQHREEVHFRVLHLVAQRPDASQREIAEELGVSLGAINYCLRALLEKGHLKLANFKASKNKLGYVYVLTPEGIAQRAALAAAFIARKRAEYEAIQAELELLHREFGEELPGAGPGERI
jgi:EPS-associated MarR family transcriptional regulator